MASAGLPTESQTVTATTNGPNQERLVLRLRQPRNDKKVSWDDGVVDNEFLDKKKSKCK